MRNGRWATLYIVLVVGGISLVTASCQPKESHFGITCATFEDCDLGQRCFEGRCIQNLREPKNPLEEQEEFAGLTYTTTKVFFNGRVNLPKNFILPYKNLRVLYGKDNFHQSVDPVNGTFWLRLNAVGTSLLVLETNYEESDRNTPIFLTIFPTNGEGYFKRANIEFSVRETAVALVFLQPALLATVNPFFNAALLERIRNLKTLDYLKQMLEDKMTIMSPSVIVSGDIDIQNVITAAVNELFNDLGQETSPAAGLSPLGMVNEDDATDTFHHIIFKEILQPNEDEVDNVYIKYYNENGPEVKAYNTMPRWVFYFVDAMPVEPALPGEVADPGVDKGADPALIVPPRNYISPKLRYLVQRYINEHDELFRDAVLADDQSNTLNAEINTYYDFEPVTEKTPLKYKKEDIDQGFLVGYLPGPDLADLDARAFDALWATYFSQIVLPMMQLSGDISDNFKTVLLNYDQISGKPLSQHPVYVVSRSIREHGLGLRVNDFMKQRRSAFDALHYKRDLFEKMMEVFQNAFMGRTVSSASFIADIQQKTDSPGFVTQMQKVSNLIYGQLAPMDIVSRFRGMDAPVIEFTDAVFNHDTGSDLYYFNEEETPIGNDDDSLLYPTSEPVCTKGACLCSTGDIPGCMEPIFAAGKNFSMGNDGQSGWFGAEAYESEKPRHRVTIEKDFYLDKYEVSVAQYKHFLNDPENKGWLREYASRGVEKCFGDDHYLDVWDQPSYAKGDKDLFPVTTICWHAANAYCKWAGRRLPTEEEWEFAARAVGECVCAAADQVCLEANAECNEFPWGNEEIFNAGSIPFRANYRNSGDPYEPSKLEKEKIDKAILDLMYPAPNLTPLGYFNGTAGTDFTSKPGMSPYGIHDMAGNAEEWVATRFFYYSDLAEGGVPTPVGDQRIVRGGSWASTRHLIRTSYRRGVNPQNNSNMIGFRCAKDAN
ncbi:MAG TPA: formylglycine-generating enzyme family protein [bacterium]|nr:formylglycine-generating enzyme family protein [bacterium]